MTLNRGVLRAIISAYFALLAVVYAIAWLAPGIGLAHDDAAFLVAAKAMAEGHGWAQARFPPLFPAVLALFALVSRQPQWLKALPLLCAIGWLVLTRRLLLRMGASGNSALLLTGLATASPTVVFLSTNLMAEPLFALLTAAALLTLLSERALLSGFLAALATLTETAGIALIVACMLTLVIRGRLRSAAIFTAVSMVMVAPWFGLALALPGNDWRASSILTALPVSDKLAVLGRNAVTLLSGPFTLLTGWTNVTAIVITAIVFLWSLIVRRRLLPDLFIAFYALLLLCRIAPPDRLVAAILPLVLWIVWRVLRTTRRREALAAVLAIGCLIPLYADAIRLGPTLADGYFPVSGPPADNWRRMQNLFAFVRADTPAGSVLVANDDDIFRLYTERRTIRGFAPGAFDLFYSTKPLIVTPDLLSSAITQAQADYVVLTPDRGLPESSAFHKSVEALERGGVVEPVSVPGESSDYRLFKVSR